MDRSFSVFGLFGSEGLTLGSLSRARNVAALTIRICFGVLVQDSIPYVCIKEEISRNLKD